MTDRRDARALHEPDEILLGFTRALRSAGRRGHPRPRDQLPRRRPHWSAPTTPRRPTGPAGRRCAASPDDLVRYDHVFEAWFGAREQLPRTMPREKPREISSPLPMGEGGESGGESRPTSCRPRRASVEVLRHRDVAQLKPDEKALLDAMIRALQPRLPRRRASRRTAWRRGEIDLHRTLRTTLRQMGEPGRVEHRRRGTTSRAGWCCWSTSRPRCVPTPTPSCGWPT